MPDRDEELAAALREYYRRLEQQPAPDVTGRVLMSVDTRTSRMRRWSVIGGGLVAAAAVAVVVVVALANHNQPTVPSPAHSATAAPTLGPTPTAAPPTATAAPVAVGPAVQGFVPTDVTAVSVNEWWVLGFDGPSCSAASCTRIVHTSDGGRTFSSIPVPAVAPASNSQQPDRLRFASAVDGWVVSGTGTVWETHDGGAHWRADGSAAAVTDLEASSGTVYAVVCGGSNCTLERSPASQDEWSILSGSAGHGMLNHLNVNGTHLWATVDSPGGGVGSLIASTDSGQSFNTHTVCPSALGYPYLYAVDGTTLWATCATGMEAAAYRSTDGGHSFSQLPAAMPLPNFASIAGVSQATAVIGELGMLRTTDGGHSFAAVEGTQAQWTVVGFTTQQDGFAFALPSSGPSQNQLWRTDDAGAHWHQVTFP